MDITPRTMMGGLRLEVTVSAPTLVLAKDIIKKTPLLNLDAYLYNKLEFMAPYQLRILTITKADYLANLKHLLAKAEMVRVFEGDNNARLRPHKKQIIIDVFNALGWNTSRMKTTAFNSADAWWLDEAEAAAAPAPAPEPEPEAPGLSLDHIKGVPAMKALFLAVRSQLPCHACPDPGYTYIWDGHVKQFRLKCTQCGMKLNQTQARQFILHLLAADELILPEEYQPRQIEVRWSPTPPAEAPVAERLATPDAPAPTTAMHLRSRATKAPSPVMEMVVEIPWVPMLESVLPLKHMVPVPGLAGVQQSTTMAKDGNCLFQAMSHHIHGTQDRHTEVRARAVAYMLGHPHLVADFAVVGNGHLGAKAWLTEMAKPGTWGDELALLALAKAYSSPLWVYSEQGGQHTTYPYGGVGPYLGLIHLGGDHYEILSL